MESTFFRAVAAVYVVTSLVTFLAYFLDKRAAVRGRRRIPEARLHGLELIGGWPGALVGQVVMRHKSRKMSYQIVFWSIVSLHVAGWIVWLGWGS